MFNLDIKKSDIYLGLRWASAFRIIVFLKHLFFVFLIIVFPLFLYAFFLGEASGKTLEIISGLFIILIVLFIACFIKEIFFNLKIKKPGFKIPLSHVWQNPSQYNLADFLDFESAKAVNNSLRYFPRSRTISSHLFYFILKDSPKLDFIFSRALLDREEIKERLKANLKNLSFSTSRGLGPGFSEDFKETLIEALNIAQTRKHQRIEIGDILVSLCKFEPVFKRILIDFNLRVEDIENLTWWLDDLEKKKEKRKRFWDYDNLMKGGTLAKQWSAAYAINLDKYSEDITDFVRKKEPEIVGHEKEIGAVERILARRKINNVLLVGEPGTGKRSIIYALAKKSLSGKSLPGLNYKRVKQLDMGSLLAGVKGIDEAEVVLSQVFQEAVSAGNIILVIDNLHNYIGQADRPGAIDISGMLAPFLNYPQFQVVAITTYDGLHRYIERNSAILSLFEKVEVGEISKRETHIILENLSLSLERKYKKIISYPAIRKIVSLTDRYMPSSAFPEKAIRILDEVIIYVSSSTKDKVVLPKHVAQVITQKTEIPVGEMEAREKEVLLNLENLIHQTVINQNEAVKEVSTAMRRARSEVTIRKGPMGAFIFLGPTGVGKTETAKALAEVYFGDEDRMIRLDMSEFQDIRDIERLIGSQKGKGILTTQVRESPFSLVLLDEFEKAHSDILNLFLQVLDEGYLTDGLGRKVNFKNTIIIATSNAGYKVILKALGENKEWKEVRQELLNYIFENAIFRPELINRFDSFVVFSSLSKTNLLDISALMLNKLRRNLEEKGIEFIITESLKKKIVELGYNPIFGAREMRRVIQDKVENVLANSLLSGKIKRGDKISMDSEFKIISK